MSQPFFELFSPQQSSNEERSPAVIEQQMRIELSVVRLKICEWKRGKLKLGLIIFIPPIQQTDMIQGLNSFSINLFIFYEVFALIDLFFLIVIIMDEKHETSLKNSRNQVLIIYYWSFKVFS